jgi:hypothetical protein
MMLLLIWRRYIGKKVATSAMGKVRMGTPTDFVGAGADTINHFGKRNAIGQQLVRIELDLVLADERGKPSRSHHQNSHSQLNVCLADARRKVIESMAARLNIAGPVPVASLTDTPAAKVHRRAL